MAELSVQMFGAPSISVDGRAVSFPYRKADALLYYLILRKKATRSELAGLLWADSDTPAAMKNLRHAIYSIRKELGFDIFFSSHSTMLELNPDVQIACDATNFLEGGELSAVQGEFLQGFGLQRSGLFEEWLTEQRNLFHTQYLERLLVAQREAFHSGDLAHAEKLALRHLQLDPLEESAAVILMELYSTQKKYRKAIGVYHELYKNLSAELSISPLRETTAFYYRIVNEWNASTYKIEEQSAHLLVGKDMALRHLLAMCNGPATERRVPCALIQGEPGVGKTYLLDHILGYYDFSGWLVCRSFCYQTETHAPFSPWDSIMMTLISEMESRRFTIPQQYLKTASRLFPCLSAGAGWEHVMPGWSHIFPQNYHVAQESVLLILAAIARRFPFLLIFEDIHWMDQNSLDLLDIFLRRMRHLNVTVICTCRDIHPPHVKQFLDNARRDNVLECYPVHRFSREDTFKFIQSYLVREHTPELMEQIYERTGGNALLLVQLMNSLQEISDLSKVPEDLGNIIGYRLANLTLEERQVLDLISVFPDWADFEVLSSILTRDPLELMHLCDQLGQRMLVLESSREGMVQYTLAHEQIKSALIARQSEGARRILHLRVAQHLETQCEQVPSLYDRLIYHFGEGGNRHKVFQYHVLSLSAYTRMYYAVLPTLTEDSSTSEPQDIPDYFHTLELELAQLRTSAQDAEGLDQLESILLHAKGRYCIYVGNYTVGLEALRRLLVLCTAAGNTTLLIQAHLQFIHYGIQIYDIQVMEEHLTIGLELLAGQELSEEYGIYLRLEGLRQTMCGNYEQSRALFQQSIDTFRRLVPGNDHRYAINIAGAYNYIAESHRLEGDYDQAFLAYDQAIIYNRSQGYYPGVAVFYTNYGVAAFQKGEKGIAYQLFQCALETYRASHEYSGRPIALSYLAFYEAEKGNFSVAAEYIREAHLVSDKIASPWWKGVTLYQCWKIREILDSRRLEEPALRALWPASEQEHCQLCLSFLRQLQPRLETQEMEDTIKRLDLSGSCQPYRKGRK